MRITIVGGGNIGTQFAVHCAETGYDVTVYTSSPELYDGYLAIVDDAGCITHCGNISLATSDPKQAFQNAELILVTLPATMMSTAAGLIYANADEKAFIGVVPGNGGSECAFKRCIERGSTFFAIERVPAIARLMEKGRIVRSTGYREELHIAAIPSSKAGRCAEIVSSIFKMPSKIIPNMLNLTMTPSNPILHTSRLYSLFHDWNQCVRYESVPLFYEEWDNLSSELLLTMDQEEQEICRAFSDFDLSYVKSLRDHYQSYTVEAMTRKISSIQAFKGLTTPTKTVDGGLIPDLHSRYFTADFSYGLSIIKQIGDIAGVETPTISRVLDWYKGIAIEKSEFRYEDYDIIDKKSLKAFYLR